MKPDDILNAIGEVDEEYVKRAHRKDLLKAFLAFFLTMAALLCVTSAMRRPDYILTRINPDFSVNTGYVDPVHLEDDGWTTLEYTGYANGTQTEKTKFRRTLYGNYTVTYTSGGETSVLSGSVRSKEVRQDHLDGERTIYSSYGFDLIGQVDSVRVYDGINSAASLNALEFEYLDNGYLMKQIKLGADGAAGYRTVDHEYYHIMGTRDYDPEGNCLGYTEYIYDEYIQTGMTYTADGQVTGTSKAEFDWFGRIRNRERYDAAGNLVSREVYRYRFWERYLGLEGVLTLAGILGLSAAIGFGVYDDRIRFPHKKEEE